MQGDECGVWGSVCMHICMCGMMCVCVCVIMGMCAFCFCVVFFVLRERKNTKFVR